eukprot:TRINITY_DN5412_c0_g1_i2.p1 TRINITY_DN5412_c0_g1~~TRINITY_DN5412_c0_g1_i2.p1  ORF type:complete len:176 (+),score=52.41 TRINITY_DN5412_c0_g1_i2:142-669(+)
MTLNEEMAEAEAQMALIDRHFAGLPDSQQGDKENINPSTFLSPSSRLRSKGRFALKDITVQTASKEPRRKKRVALGVKKTKIEQENYDGSQNNSSNSNNHNRENQHTTKLHQSSEKKRSVRRTSSSVSSTATSATTATTTSSAAATKKKARSAIATARSRRRAFNPAVTTMRSIR